MSSSSNQFSTLLLEGLDHYRKGRMMEAVRAWEQAYMLEPTNVRAREFLRSALERIHAHMSTSTTPGGEAPPQVVHPWLPEPSPAKAAPAEPLVSGSPPRLTTSLCSSLANSARWSAKD